VSRANDITRLWLTPEAVAPSDDALRAIADAELIVLGPGSLYTSILPPLLIPAIRDAIATSPALRVYACNVATQRGETEGFDLGDHLEALERHAGAGLVDVVVANNNFSAEVPTDYSLEPVRLRWPADVASGTAPRLVLEDVVDPENGHHHDPVRLASTLLRVLESEGARRRSSVARTA
jgi:uncharacterized cofD-like protein